MTSLRIEAEPRCAIRDPALRRPEGLAISPDGGLLAVSDAEANRVALYERRGEGGHYGSEPVSVLCGDGSRLDYAHDLDFSPDGCVLAVANRWGASISLYERRGNEPHAFPPRPGFEIRGWLSRLIYTDGVQFVPPAGELLAAINRETSSVNFYRRRAGGRLRFQRRPCFRLSGPRTRIAHPDGLGFSRDGELLAVTNHGHDSVTIFRRATDAFRYEATPVAEIAGPAADLHCPHSVAFTPSRGHLAVSNAGGRTVNLYRGGPDPGDWDPTPVAALPACDPERFDEIHARNDQEGGSKGLAIHADRLAVCGAEIGIRLHAYSED